VLSLRWQSNLGLLQEDMEVLDLTILGLQVLVFGP